MMRRALASCISSITCVAVATLPVDATASTLRHTHGPASAPAESAAPAQPPAPAPAPAPAESAAPTQPGPPTPAEPAAPERPGPPTPAAEEPAAQPPAPQAIDEESPLGRQGEASGVIVHVINEHPNEDRGRLKLARYGGTTTTRSANIIVLTTEYEEICTEPCGVPVDISDRPIFFFVRDETAVSHGFRLKTDEPEVTLSVRPQRRGMLMTGLYLTSLFLLPITIPLMVLGRSTVSLAPGAPSPTQGFRRLAKART